MTSSIIAKAVVRNKYWIVEDSGQKIATIQAIDEGGVVYVHDNEREVFPSIKGLSKKYNIVFAPDKKAPGPSQLDINGYPCDGLPHNAVWDVRRKLPVYSKTAKSKSFYCAGYYLIKYNSAWVQEYCPKMITLSRYEFIGPFKTRQEQQAAYVKALHGTH